MVHVSVPGEQGMDAPRAPQAVPSHTPPARPHPAPGALPVLKLGDLNGTQWAELTRDGLSWIGTVSSIRSSSRACARLSSWPQPCRLPTAAPDARLPTPFSTLQVGFMPRR